MQSNSLNNIQLTQLEPVDHLGAYLSNLDVDEAVQSFGQLADQLQSLDHQQQQQPTRDQNHHLFATYPSFVPASSPAASERSLLSYSSPQGVTSPAASYFSWCSSSTCSTGSPSSTFLTSSGPSSVASSCDLRDERDCVSRKTTNLATSAGSRFRRGDERRRNASAAGKYRRRLKGREWGLVQEMEQEEARNARLRNSLEAKLSLYREFVSLLARNTSELDTELASFGSRSLSAIMDEVLEANGQNSRQRDHIEPEQQVLVDDNELDLRRLLYRFQSILAQAGAREHSPLTWSTSSAYVTTIQ